MKSNLPLQDKLAKQNEISRQKLARELVKLEKVEKSDLRMIETARHRFRSRHKKLEAQQESSSSNAINVRMYETHNPGFCYHCTGAIKESGSSAKEKIRKDSYEFVRSILFTNGEVDRDKVLCLHLLTAHSTKWNNNDGCTVRPVSPLLEQAKKKHYTGAWNNILPCYVVDTQPDLSTLTVDVKLHEDPRKQGLEDQAIRDFEEKYRQYMKNHSDFGNVLSNNVKQNRMVPCGLGKMPIISPHVYSILGASHELKIKQALVESSVKRRIARSSMDFKILDENSISFHLDDEDDVLSRATTTLSTRNGGMTSKHSPSRRSTFGSAFKLDHSITMLKSKHGKHSGCLEYRSRNYEDAPKDLITIKPSFRNMKDAPSKTSSTKSPFRHMFGSRPSSNSMISSINSPGFGIRKCRKCIYLNSPIKSIELQNKEYKTVAILVNYQIQALVHSILEVLGRVCPEKLKKIIETARDTEEIKKMFIRPEIQSFIQSLLGQSLISSPESFVISAATVADEIDFRFEGILEKEVIALTLEMPPEPFLEALIAEIRNSIFLDVEEKNKTDDNLKVLSSLDEQKVRKEDTVKDFQRKKTPVNNDKARQGSMKLKEKYDVPKKSADTGNVNEIHKVNKNKKQVVKKSNKNPVTHNTKSDNIKKSSKKEASLQEASSKQQKDSGNNLAKRSSSGKAWKGAQDPGYLDADHVILRRMTNTQRILVGQMCASLKSKRINNEGLLNERVPLAALITPALSRDTIRFLTRGTIYSKTENANQQNEDIDDNVAVADKLTGPVLAKIRQDVAENETNRRLKTFLQHKIE